MSQMEIVNALMGVWFALSLAALVATPTLISVYMELRALKRLGVKQKASGLLVAYPTPVPFNYPAMFGQEAPGKTIRPDIADGDAAQQSMSAMLEAYPTPVPFNYPQLLSGKGGE
jgi:hypothetical protein